MCARARAYVYVYKAPFLIEIVTITRIYAIVSINNAWYLFRTMGFINLFTYGINLCIQ